MSPKRFPYQYVGTREKIQVIDVENGCQEVSSIPILFDDVEGIAWLAGTCPIQ